MLALMVLMALALMVALLMVLMELLPLLALPLMVLLAHAATGAAQAHTSPYTIRSAAKVSTAAFSWASRTASSRQEANGAVEAGNQQLQQEGRGGTEPGLPVRQLVGTVDRVVLERRDVPDVGA